MSEKQLQSNFSAWLNRRGFLFHKNHGGEFHTKSGKYSLKSGWPDLEIADRNGILLFVELKTNVGILNQGQMVLIEQLKKLGHKVFVFRPKHYEKLKEYYKKNPQTSLYNALREVI